MKIDIFAPMIQKHLFIVLAIFFISCEPEIVIDSSNVESFVCDAETIIDEAGDKKYATTDPNILLSQGITQSSDFARSGKYSAKLDSVNKYAFKFTLSNVKQGDYLRFSVWQKLSHDKASLAVNIYGEDAHQEIKSSYYDITEQDGDWIQHNVSLIVSEGLTEIKVHVFSGGKLSYFDDFAFEKKAAIPKNDLLPELNIQFGEKSKIKLKSFVKQASKERVIASRYKKYVKGHIFHEGELKKIKAKLKGDWTDHLSSGKVSLRIKMRGNSAYNGLKTYSIQHPRTRSYVSEWFVHKLADELDILSTKFDFVNVAVNNNYYGVFVLEEHFDKQLLEQRNRREGPILKFDESGVWQISLKESSDIRLIDFPYYEGALVKPFKENRTTSSEVLSKNFEEGAKLMTLFKNGHIPVEDIFDVDQLAKYYVLLDLCGGYHSSAWHNRRFYFNPITQKLEHIVYDVMPFSYGTYFINSIEAKLPDAERGKDASLTNAVMLSRPFKEKYLYYLKEMTTVAYLDSMFGKYQGQIDTLTLAIQVEEPYYHLNQQIYYDNAEHMRKAYNRLNDLWEKTLAKNLPPSHWTVDKTYESRSDTVFFEGVALNAYMTRIDSNQFSVEVENYHVNDISITAWEKGDSLSTRIQFEKAIKLGGFKKNPAAVNLKFNEEPKKLFFTVQNKGYKEYAAKIIPWKKPTGVSNRMELAKSNKSKPLPYAILNNKAVFNKDVIIENLVSIPSKYEVEVKPGVSICFSNGGGLIVNNSFTAVGSKVSPIKIFCIDGTSHGLTVLNAKNTVMEFVEFSGLSNLHYKNWILTGGVTVYESDVRINEIKITNALSEDGLNIVRSHFEINNLFMDGTFSDGFDADFCTGSISNSVFKNTGNDCVDFSGSTISLENIEIENSGDKGVSGGERSYLTLANINIQGAITGIAAKDQSILTGKSITIDEVTYGLMAFRKKAEYGSASIDFELTTIENADTVLLVDKGSQIKMNGELTKGQTKLDVDLLYARFEK